MLPFQSKNGITAMASLARDTRLITADSAGLFYSHSYGFIGLFRVILLFETTANLNVEKVPPSLPPPHPPCEDPVKTISSNSPSFPPRSRVDYLQPGAHNPERATPIQGLCHGVFTDQFIFRHILGHFLQRK